MKFDLAFANCLEISSQRDDELCMYNLHCKKILIFEENIRRFLVVDKFVCFPFSIAYTFYDQITCFGNFDKKFFFFVTQTNDFDLNSIRFFYHHYQKQM